MRERERERERARERERERFGKKSGSEDTDHAHAVHINGAWTGAASIDVKFVVRVPEYNAPSRLSPNVTAAQVYIVCG